MYIFISCAFFMKKNSVKIIFVFFFVEKESLTPTKKNPCIGQKMCGDCVGGGKDCAWCQAPV
jgi:hypothetical protein